MTTGHSHRQLSRTFLFAAVVACLLIVLIASICIGQYPISLHDIGEIITGRMPDTLTRRVFLRLRLPRALMGLLGGLGLGLSGSIYQTIFKNPLASPDIIGVAGGANLGSAIAIVMLGASTFAIASGAFIGGIAVVLLVLVLARLTPTSTTVTYVLAGIVMSSISKALIMLLKFFADPANELAAIEFWTMGSLANITDTKLLAILPIFLLSAAGLLLLRRQIELMHLSEDECRTLGMPLYRVRLLILSLSTLLTASIIAVTGLIAFIGLIAPHIARLMLRRNNFATCLMSALVGAIVLTSADILARNLYTAEIPISIFTTVIGVPILVWFMCRQREI